ncbi:hypothetical protein K435DRAFT_804727 [Dendrothele bispora CBS 962.96]|uniref:Ribonuclease H1 N-terminal domain-containing protein n=1 Tax=Dendrothele bispora (strain CBS 962.96) TaxID=1314807 RepID=A0A4V4HDD9_DENBC|nr:hypothetical protein K435DRAFT_804727 [Dendrothele bispora CBS 962.96]
METRVKGEEKSNKVLTSKLSQTQTALLHSRVVESEENIDNSSSSEESDDLKQSIHEPPPPSYYLGPGPSTSVTHDRFVSDSASGQVKVTSGQSPKRSRKAYSAYVIYRSSSETGVFESWSVVQKLVNGDKNAVFKGFQSKETAQLSYALTADSGILELIKERDEHYTVVEGVSPGTYTGPYALLRDGLNWSSGVVRVFSTENAANAFFVGKYMAGAVVTMEKII